MAERSASELFSLLHLAWRWRQFNVHRHEKAFDQLIEFIMYQQRILLEIILDTKCYTLSQRSLGDMYK